MRDQVWEGIIRSVLADRVPESGALSPGGQGGLARSACLRSKTTQLRLEVVLVNRRERAIPAAASRCRNSRPGLRLGCIGPNKRAGRKFGISQGRARETPVVGKEKPASVEADLVEALDRWRTHQELNLKPSDP